jgi:glycosyltransferase involved in cell wall biosynthesis
VPAVVHTYHGHVLRGYFGPAKTRLFRALERALSGITDVPVAVSGRVRDELAEMKVAPRDAFRVVPLGLELERFTRPRGRGALRSLAGWADTDTVIATVGRLVPIKDLATFLRAAARVAGERAATRFAIVGDGDLRAALEAEAASLGLAGRVHFFGWRSDLEDVYADADVVVNSSRNEGTPVALIEALAAGKPVVATAVGGTPDLLAEGAHGTLVPAGDPDALARAIADVLADPAAAAARARTGQRHVLATYSSERLVRDIDSLYRELLHKAPAAA